MDTGRQQKPRIVSRGKTKLQIRGAKAITIFIQKKIRSKTLPNTELKAMPLPYNSSSQPHWHFSFRYKNKCTRINASRSITMNQRNRKQQRHMNYQFIACILKMIRTQTKKTVMFFWLEFSKSIYNITSGYKRNIFVTIFNYWQIQLDRICCISSLLYDTLV